MQETDMAEFGNPWSGGLGYFGDRLSSPVDKVIGGNSGHTFVF